MSAHRLFNDEIENLSFFDPLTDEVKRRVPRLAQGRSFALAPWCKLVSAL